MCIRDSWRAAVRASDVPRIVSYYAEDIVAFDAILQLQFKGRDAYQKHWQACTEMCKGPMTFDIAELQIHADPQVAFAHYLCHCGGTGPDGQPHSSWMRVSAGYRKPVSYTHLYQSRPVWTAPPAHASLLST